MKDIDALKELQKIDAEIFKIKIKLKEKPEELIKLENNFASLSGTLKVLEEQLKKIQLEHKEKELELLLANTINSVENFIFVKLRSLKFGFALSLPIPINVF